MANLDLFESKCDALGLTASEDQMTRLVDWALFYVAKTDWDEAATIASEYGLYDVATDIDMHIRECGY